MPVFTENEIKERAPKKPVALKTTMPAWECPYCGYAWRRKEGSRPPNRCVNVPGKNQKAGYPKCGKSFV
jgi:rubrerythrin